MSLVSSRVSLRHRCRIERDSATGANPHGGKPKPVWATHIDGQPCRLGLTAGQEAVDATTTAVIEDMRLILPLGVDVTERDRIAAVTDRGQSFIDGPVGIRAVLRRQDHLELVLVRIS